MQTFHFHFRKVTLTAFMMFAVASMGWIVSCNKEQGVQPPKEETEDVSVKNFKSNEYLKLSMFTNIGAYKAPENYKRVDKSRKLHKEIYLLNDINGNIAMEIYHYDNWENYYQERNCTKQLHSGNSEGNAGWKCEGPGSNCEAGVDVNGNATIIICTLN